MYDVTNWESFQKLDKLKKDIDKNRDKKEVISCLYCHTDECTIAFLCFHM